MKKLIFVFGLMLAMTACSGNVTVSTESVDSTSVDTIEVVDSALADTITSDSIN